jgi:hypothetical protein
MTREQDIRAKLEPYVLDGTEALQAIRVLLDSPNRPRDLMKAIGKILARQYRDCVHIDAVVDVLDHTDFFGSPRSVRAPTGADPGLAPDEKDMTMKG